MVKQMAKKNFLFKLFLVGDSEVGKTCVQTRYVEDTFRSTYSPAIGELSLVPSLFFARKIGWGRD